MPGLGTGDGAQSTAVLKKSNVIVLVAASAAFSVIAVPARAGVVFTATTKAESPTARLVSLVDSTVRGWIDGDRGRVEFLQSRNGAWPRGSILLTNDGGRTVRFFDPAAGKCRPWTPLAIPGARPPAVTGASASFENLRVEKTRDEPGPMVAGLATRHYRVAISYDTSQGSAGGIHRSHTDRVDDVWVSPDLTDPAFAIWLTTGVRWTGSSELDRKIGKTMAGIRGTPLRRVTVERVGFDGRPPLTTTTTVEVTLLTRESVAASRFLEPFPCKILRPEDRR
jgi:hypothetical protein